MKSKVEDLDDARISDARGRARFVEEPLKWRKVFSTAGGDRGWSNTFGTSGDILATVNMGGTYNFGFPITGPAAPASVVLRITP